ncbi:MAG: LysE family transporter [Firmicutes bacterium]|nr:LysE family transporter [Bacillota bacterium]
MTAWGLFFTALMVGLSGALMPGPLLTVNLKESLKRGAWIGPKLVLGHGLLELALVLAVLFGFGRFLDRNAVKGAIGLLGGAVLLFMAYGMIRESFSGLAALPSVGEDDRRGLPPVLAGALISLSNPYWTLWWATIGLTYLSRARELGAVGVTLFFSGHILADLAWYSLVSFAAANGRRVMGERAYRVVVAACGLFLVYVGFRFIAAAWGFLGWPKIAAIRGKG